MNRIWRRFKQFWLAEEVPRWIGLSLVLLYVVGLTAVAWTVLSQARIDGQREDQERTARSLAWFGELLARTDPDDLPARQLVLHQFAGDYACDELRVFDRQRLVLASTRSTEIGTTVPTPHEVGTFFPRKVELHSVGVRAVEGTTLHLFRGPVAIAGEIPQHFFEGIMPMPYRGGVPLHKYVSTLTVILVASGVMLLLYRRMRAHFRGISQIAENLQGEPDRLLEELDSLRVKDSLGTIATTWNQLIDTLDELHQASRRVTASDELRQALERSTGGELADALNALPDGLFYVSDGDALRYVNSTARRVLGAATVDDEPSPRLDEVNASGFGAQVLEAIRSARRDDGRFETRTENVEDQADGGTYRLRVHPMRHQRGGECLVTVSDISQQVRADRAREDFVSQVTHELRTPLTNIRAYAETLSSGMFDDPQIITDCYNVITKETRRLSRLIEDILSISQMEVGSIQLDCDDVDLRSLISDVVRDLRGLADEKTIDLQMALPSKLEPIRADRDKLAVVLNNLVGNALKYTPSGGSVRVGCKVSESELLITVKDSGIGIDPSDHERVFEKFQRAADPEVQNETGSGIGLTTAREIVRRHGGEIEVMSAKGQGSTFVVKVPVTAPTGESGIRR